MEDEMNMVEELIRITEENQTRKILMLISESDSLQEAEEKIKALLNK